MAQADISDDARALHKRSIVFDGHSDTLIENLAHPVTPDFSHRTDKLHMDLGRSLEGGLTAAFFMVGGNLQPRTWLAIDRMCHETEASAGRFVLARVADDIRQAKEGGKVAGMMSFEGGLACEGELAILRHFHRLGVRCIGITHGENVTEHSLQGDKSHFGFCDLAARRDALRSKRGLTPFGREAVKEMNRLGMLIDVAHCNDRAFWDLIECSSSAIVCTHGNCFALSPHSRNLTDDQLKALGEKGGVIGLAFFPPFIDPKEPTLGRLLDHAEHAIEVAGVDAVGIGSDYDGMGRNTPIVPEVGRLPELTQAMLDRGFPAPDVEQILGANFLRVIGEVIG